MSYKSLLALVQALDVCFTIKTREDMRVLSSFFSGGMSSQTGLESQFSPGISSHNRPSGNRFEARNRESETNIQADVFNILTSSFSLN